MTTITLMWAPALIAAASASQAQVNPQDHAQHQASGQHQAVASDKQCCCEEMMRKMMMEMMQKHSSMGAARTGEQAGADKPIKAPQEHKH